MTKKEAEARLKSWGSYISAISGIEEEIRELKLSLQYNRELKALNLEAIPKAKRVNKPTENAAVKNIGVLEEEIKAAQEKILRIKKKREQTEEFVESLDQIEQRLLRFRYIKKKTWRSISMRIYVSLRQCYRIHNRILADMCCYFENKTSREA